MLKDCGFNTDKVKKTGVLPKLRIKDGHFNLSGAETRLMRYAGAPGDIDSACVTAELFASVSDLLISDALYLSEKHSVDNIYMAGGVASSRTFRAIAAGCTGAEIRFGDPALSGDNAVGTALLAKRKYETGNRISGK